MVRGQDFEAMKQRRLRAARMSERSATQAEVPARSASAASRPCSGSGPGSAPAGRALRERDAPGGGLGSRRPGAGEWSPLTTRLSVSL